MTGRPPVPWQFTCDWARDNEVSGDSLCMDTEGRAITGVHASGDMVVLEQEHGRDAITWDELKARVGEGRGDLTVWLSDGSRVRDLSNWVVVDGYSRSADDPEGPEFYFQRRWG